MLTICTRCGAHNAISSRVCIGCGEALLIQKEKPVAQATITRSASLPLGKYTLDMSIDCFADLVEFTATEYAIYGRHFDGERNYNAPKIGFVKRQWEVALGTVWDKVYKIALFFESESSATVNDVSTDVMQFCLQHLGSPSEEREDLIVWDASDGNVLLQFSKVADTYVINLFETSNAVRTFTREAPMTKASGRANRISTSATAVAQMSLAAAFGGITLILMIIVNFGSISFHIWTVIIAFQNAGWFGAILSAVLPVVSWVYWFIYGWNRYGIFGSWYNVSFVALLGAWFLYGAILGIMSWLGIKTQKAKEAAQ